MHEEYHEKICEMRKRLIDAVKSQMDAGIEHIDTKEMGEVIDMIKDLYEAEKYRKEACYYGSIIDAMEDASEEGHSDRMGYDGNHVRFDPFGDYMRKDSVRKIPVHEAGNMRMGYPGEDKGMMDDDYRYGRAYNDYRKARRHYTQTKAATDKEMMDEKASDHLSDTIHTIHEIWDMADPNLRKKMKADLQKLVGEMTI